MELLRRIVDALAIAAGRPSFVRRLERDPVEVAKILLVFRMIIAGGRIGDREMRLFAEICRRHFAVPEAEMAALHAFLEARQAAADEDALAAAREAMTARDRLELIAMLAAVARAGGSAGDVAAGRPLDLAADGPAGGGLAAGLAEAPPRPEPGARRATPR